MSSKFVVIGHRSVRMVRGAILAAGGRAGDFCLQDKMRGVPLEFCLRPLYNVRGPKLGGSLKKVLK